MAGINDDARRILVNGEELSFATDRSPRRNSKFHPMDLPRTRDLLGPKIREMVREIAAVPPELRAERVVIEGEVWANYLANSWFPQHLIRQLDLRPLGSRIIRDGVKITEKRGRETSTSKSYLLSADSRALTRILDLLDGPDEASAGAKAANELIQFNDFKLAQALRRDEANPAGELSSYEAVLHPDPDTSSARRRSPASKATLAKFESLVRSVGGDLIGHVDEVDGLTFVSVRIPPAAAPRIAQFNPLRSLSPMPELSVSQAPVETEPAPAAHASVREVQALPKVLVFDGGVDDTGPVFAGVVTAIDLTGKGLVHSYSLHGSAVTAAVLYGDVQTRGSFGQPVAEVEHYQVLPCPVPQQPTEYPWVLQQIRETVEKSDAKLVNLSLGPKVPIDDGEPHRWTAVLDKLAFDHGILFVNAAGNNGEHPTEGLERIQVPGDMVNGLTVGASDTPNTSPSWDAAPYSARGPGRPGSRIQPSVVSYGGTQTARFGRVRPDGSIHRDDHGTSYSTPQVTNMMARLTRELGGRADPPTLRALAVHFAERAESHDQAAVGHGRVTDDLLDRLSCAPEEATVMYHGILGRSEVRAYPVPFPAAFPGGDIELAWTVAFSTATDAAEAGEYTNAGLETFFRPHASRRSMQLEVPDGSPKSRSVDIGDRAEIERLLAAGWTLPKAAKTRTPKQKRLFEGDLRELGKWETVLHFRDRIRSTSMHKPHIEINHLSREGGRITRDTDDIEFSLVMTMRSVAGKPLYDLVVDEFSALLPFPVLAQATTTAQASANS